MTNVVFSFREINQQNEKYKSYCSQDENTFNYYGIKKALCGKEGRTHPFTPKRILVIQMK